MLAILWILISNISGIIFYAVYCITLLDDNRNKFILVVGWITMLMLDLFAFSTLIFLWKHIMDQSDELSLVRQPLSKFKK
jgi:hypothetical protein